MKCKVEDLGDLARVVLQGEVTIQTIAPLKETLLQCLSDKQRIIVDVDEVTRADLSFLQLLCSAHKQATLMGKGLAFGGTRKDVITSLIRECGYARRQGCPHDATHTCLWVLGGRP